jgi:hypothetical protein
MKLYHLIFGPGLNAKKSPTDLTCPVHDGFFLQKTV